MSNSNFINFLSVKFCRFEISKCQKGDAESIYRLSSGIRPCHTDRLNSGNLEIFCPDEMISISRTTSGIFGLEMTIKFSLIKFCVGKPKVGRIKYYFRPKKVGKISHKLTFGLLNRHGIAGWPKDPNEHLSFAFVCTGKLFLNIRTPRYISENLLWNMNILYFTLEHSALKNEKARCMTLETLMWWLNASYH